MAELDTGARLLSVVYDFEDPLEPEEMYVPPGADTSVGCRDPNGSQCTLRVEHPAGSTFFPPFDLQTPTHLYTHGAANASYTDEGIVATDDGDRRRTGLVSRRRRKRLSRGGRVTADRTGSS